MRVDGEGYTYDENARGLPHKMARSILTILCQFHSWHLLNRVQTDSL